MEPIWFLIGVIVGASLVLVVLVVRRAPEQERARRLFEFAETQANERKNQDLERILAQLKDSFKALSGDVLRDSSTELLKLAETKLGAKSTESEQTLESKRKLIDAKIDAMTHRLGELDRVLQTYRDERSRMYGQLAQQLKTNREVTVTLQQTAAELNEALAGTKQRGQWGERMAEDVLRLAGFIEGVNYQKQRRIDSGEIPDFTFLLPHDLMVHMDVKFPASNYLAFLRAEDETTRGEYKKQFLRDVRTRIKEVTDRTYIDPAGGTVDCTIVFIPNEQIFEFIQQQDGTILDEALRKKVVLCSPLTLYAVLAIIRQAVDNFRLEQASNEILALLGTFAKQWANYKDEMAKVGKQMQTVLNTFQSLEGTRTRQLEKPLDKIENIRQERGIATDSEAPALRQLSDDGDEG